MPKKTKTALEKRCYYHDVLSRRAKVIKKPNPNTKRPLFKATW
jgi:hypothetical protein